MKHFGIMVVFLLAFLPLNPAYSMEKSPEAPHLERFPSSTNPQNSTTNSSNSDPDKILPKPSLNDLPAGLMTHITDYLDYQTQFALAQTSRQQLFLWASTNRVPEAVPVVTATSDITHLKWEDTDWPPTVSQTVVIEVEEDIKQEKLDRLKTIENLENVLHLHFETQSSNELTIDIGNLVERCSISSKFSSLQSLVFKRVIPTYRNMSSSLQTLQNLIIQGRAVPSKERQIFLTGRLVQDRPNLKNLYFLHSDLKAETLSAITGNLYDRNCLASRLVEIRDNTLDLDGNRIKQQEPWENGFNFRLKPWVIEEDGNARVLYRRDRAAPGPSRPRQVIVRSEQGLERLTWRDLFTFLSPTYFTAADLIPVMRTWSAAGRLRALSRLIPGSQVESQSQGESFFILPEDLQRPFTAFWHREGRPLEERLFSEESTHSQETSQQTSEEDTIPMATSSHSEEALTEASTQSHSQGTDQSQQTSEEDIIPAATSSHSEDFSTEASTRSHSQEDQSQQPSREDTVRVAASLYSEEVLTIPVQTLINVIEENTQNHPELQTFLNQPPSLSDARERTLGWLREVLEFFTGETANETSQSNNGEVLVGTQLMAVLRGLLNSQ